MSWEYSKEWFTFGKFKIRLIFSHDNTMEFVDEILNVGNTFVSQLASCRLSFHVLDSRYEIKLVKKWMRYRSFTT